MRCAVRKSAAVVVETANAESKTTTLREALEDHVAAVIVDARTAPEAYLQETLVLEGGE
jgi:hypothetical protein